MCKRFWNVTSTDGTKIKVLLDLAVVDEAEGDGVGSYADGESAAAGTGSRDWDLAAVLAGCSLTAPLWVSL